MKSRRKNKLILGSAILLCLVAILTFTYCFIRINNKYPATIERHYKLGEVYSNGEFEISVLKSQILTLSELKKQFGELENYNSENTVSSEDQVKIFVSEVNVKNTSSAESRFHLYHIVASTLTWANGIDMELFIDLNSKDGETPSMQPSIKPGDSKKILIPFDAYDSQFTKSQWKNLDDEDKALIYTLYPEKIMFDLKTQ